MKKTILTIGIVFIWMVGAASATKSYDIAEPSTVNYYVEHTIGFSSGQFLDFGGTIVLSNDEKKVISVQVTIQTDSLSTHNEIRENGLKSENFLNVENFPTITIKSKKITKDKIIADVTILGETKTVEFRYFDYGVMPMEGVPTAMVAMQGNIDRRDFGMDYNVQSEETGRDMLGTEFEITMHLDGPLKE